MDLHHRPHRRAVDTVRSVDASRRRDSSNTQLNEADYTYCCMTAVIMILVAASMVTAFLIAIANLPGQMLVYLEPFVGSPILLMMLIVITVFAIGMVLDFTPAITILVPVLLPIVIAAGIDPIYFGVMFIMTAAVGMITPPVGAVLNTLCGISRISMDQAVKGVLPFLFAEILVLVILVLFPALVTVPASWFS